MPFSVEERFVAAEEERLGVRLPPSFRAYLLRNNGGEIAVEGDDWWIAPVFDASDRKRMGRTTNHIARETTFARSWRGFPPVGVAFASNGAGDTLVFLPEADDHRQLCEAVLLWHHETGEITRVAASFGELVPTAGGTRGLGAHHDDGPRHRLRTDPR